MPFAFISTLEGGGRLHKLVDGGKGGSGFPSAMCLKSVKDLRFFRNAAMQKNGAFKGIIHRFLIPG
jgi:hypothetical protein